MRALVLPRWLAIVGSSTALVWTTSCSPLWPSATPISQAHYRIGRALNSPPLNNYEGGDTAKG